MLKELLREGEEFLKKGGIINPRREVEVVLSYLLKKPPLFFYREPERKISSWLEASFWKMLERRKRGIPLSYLTREVEFMGFKFKILPGVFIPRPETELLVEEALKRVKGKVKGIDLGCGCGCIGISVVKNLPQSFFYGVDNFPLAVKLSFFNARKLRVEKRTSFLEGDLFKPLRKKGLEGKIDLILSNPPYILEEDFPFLPEEVRAEPSSALYAGKDGLLFYHRIVEGAFSFLKEGGLLILEIGFRQVEKIPPLAGEKGFKLEEVKKDYAGKERVVVLRK